MFELKGSNEDVINASTADWAIYVTILHLLVENAIKNLVNERMIQIEYDYK